MHEIEPLAYIAHLVDRLAEFRDLPKERKVAGIKTLMTPLLADA